MSIEYIIWGKAPGHEHECVLVSEHEGIASRAEAERVCDKLRDAYGCTDVRIQEFSFGDGSEVLAAFRSAVA